MLNKACPIIRNFQLGKTSIDTRKHDPSHTILILQGNRKTNVHFNIVSVWFILQTLRLNVHIVIYLSACLIAKIGILKFQFQQTANVFFESNGTVYLSFLPANLCGIIFYSVVLPKIG